MFLCDVAEFTEKPEKKERTPLQNLRRQLITGGVAGAVLPIALQTLLTKKLPTSISAKSALKTGLAGSVLAVAKQSVTKNHKYKNEDDQKTSNNLRKTGLLAGGLGGSYALRESIKNPINIPGLEEVSPRNRKLVNVALIAPNVLHKASIAAGIGATGYGAYRVGKSLLNRKKQERK